MKSTVEADLLPRAQSRTRQTTCQRVKVLIWCFCIILFILLSPHFYSWRDNAFSPGYWKSQLHDDHWCPLPELALPIHDGLGPSDRFMKHEHLELQVSRLSAAVRIPTESYDDSGPVGVDPRWDVFQEFHELLAELFPLTHSRLNLRKVNKYGLMYTFKGTNSSMKPVMFMAHQDVVPADANSTWTYPPFSGHYDGLFLWGRGSTDCKNVLIGILSVIEDLLLQSFSPQRTIILTFGFDEETGGNQGAAELSKSLESQWGRDSFLLVLDEGGMGLQTLGNVLYAHPAVSEKGYYDSRLRLQVKGGHSSKPPPNTGIGIMAEMIVALEKEPYTPRLTHSNPFRRVLECRAKFSPDAVQPWLRDALLHDGEEEIGRKLAGESLVEQWLMQTSQAVDVITGGIKVNALPESVEVMVNYRIALDQSVASIEDRIRNVVRPIAEKYNLNFDGLASSHSRNSHNTANGRIEMEAFNVVEPAPMSPTNNIVWSTFSGTLRSVFETTSTGYGRTVVPVGNIMTGNTDTMHFWHLTRNIYRFTPSRNGTRLNTHAIDERMDMTAHLEGMRFYYDLIRNFDKYHE